MSEINPYINFHGQTEEAFKFYKSVFGGEFKEFQRYKDMPDSNKMFPDDQEKVMHVALSIGKNSVLMGSDALQSMGQKILEGNNYYISVMPESEEETTKIFNALSEGGKIVMPLQKTFWGAYYGMFNDKFGIQWMVNYSYEQKQK